MGKLYRIFFLSVLIPTLSVAQTLDCEQTIALATDEFNAGHFYSVPGILSECLSSLNRDQRQRAHLLLTQTYLLLDDPIGAQRSYLEVLAANPEFVPDEQVHSIDVVYLSKRFTATPKFSWFVSAGTNVSPIRVLVDNELGSLANPGSRKQAYSLRPGYHIGAGGEYSLMDNLRVRAEANFVQCGYKLSVNGHIEGDSRTFTERQLWVNVPVYLSYTDNRGRNRPYGYVGASMSKLFSASASVRHQGRRVVDSSEGMSESVPATSPNVDFLGRRRSFNPSLVLGAGIKHKVGLDFVFTELRYSAGLKNVVDPRNLYADPEIEHTSPEYVRSQDLQAFGHVDDFFRLDNIGLTVGYIRPLYKPRELKRVRTQSVLRKMKKGK